MSSLNLTIISLGLFVLFVSAEISSLVFKVYNQRFYSIFHFAGGALTYLFSLNFLADRILSLGIVLLVGILWEAHEWLLWKLVYKDRKNKPGGLDTRNDLIFDILGALFFYVIELF